MKRYAAIVLILLLLFIVAASHTDGSAEIGIGSESDRMGEAEDEAGIEAEVEAEAEVMKTDHICIKVGESTLAAVLENNESAEALKELLADGELTISASNYGGFEKVCDLGTELPRNDSQITTHAGDICLYNGKQIVIFYGSNSWAYTKIGRISDTDGSELEKILSGEETEITIFLE